MKRRKIWPFVFLLLCILGISSVALWYYYYQSGKPTVYKGIFVMSQQIHEDHGGEYNGHLYQGS